MLDPDHLLRYAIRPALEHMGIGGQAAEELVLGTAIVESGLIYLKQHGNGPALGLWQMEPATHDDVYETFLIYQVNLRRSLNGLVIDRDRNAMFVDERRIQMTWNLRYGAAMCRLKYYRDPKPLPAAGDIEAQGDYWKRIFNSWRGKGTVEKYVRQWHKVMG